MAQNLPLVINREAMLELLLQLRLEKSLSENGLEKLAGVPKDTIRDFERGKAHLIRADKLQKLLNALGYQLSITRL